MSRATVCLIVAAILLAPFLPRLFSRKAENAADRPGEPLASAPASDSPEAFSPAEKPEGSARRPQRQPPIAARDLLLKGDEPEPEAIIEELLAKPIDVKFADLPLEEALNRLHELQELPIWLDRQALVDAAIATDTPVTLELQAARFESALNLLLAPLGLDWLIQDEVLKVTTQKRAQALADVRSYDVQNLLDAGHTPEDLVSAITSCVEPDSWMARGGTGAVAHSGGVLICRQSQRVQQQVAMLLEDLDLLVEQALDDMVTGGKAVITLKVYHTDRFPADELARAIPELVDPKSWQAQGGPGSLQAIRGALLVRQTSHGHREIEKVLKQLLPPGPPGVPTVPVGPPASDPFGTKNRKSIGFKASAGRVDTVSRTMPRIAAH